MSLNSLPSFFASRLSPSETSIMPRQKQSGTLPVNRSAEQPPEAPPINGFANETSDLLSPVPATIKNH